MRCRRLSVSSAKAHNVLGLTTIDINNYNRFTIKYFKYSTADYIFNNEIKIFKRDLKYLTIEIAE